MKYHELLLETRVDFTKQELQTALDNNEYHIVYITVSPDGHMSLGSRYDNALIGRWNFRNSLEIVVNGNDHSMQIKTGSFGEHLSPRAQQAIRALRDAGILDTSWTLSTRRGAGYWPLSGSQYITDKEPIDNKSLDELADKAIRLSPITQHLVFYHGTSAMDWERIQKTGLHPADIGKDKLQGGESRGKHEGNAGVLYLAATTDKALSYAKTRTELQNRKNRGTKAAWNNYPVVLRVWIPDPAKLVADDDVIISLAQKISSRLWNQKTEEERQEIADRLKVNTFVAELMWRETEGFEEIMRHIPKRAYRAWMSSLIRNEQVGYRGIIPPKFITEIIQSKP